MERFVKGDVVVLPFPYTDFSTIKKRPALLVATLQGSNIILAQITTHKRNDPHLISLSKEDFGSGFLKHDSFIVPSIIFTSDLSKIEYKVGTINQRKIREVEDKLVEIFTRN